MTGDAPISAALGSVRYIYIYMTRVDPCIKCTKVSWRRVKWPRPSWIRKTFCLFVESCRVAAPFRGSTSVVFSGLLSACILLSVFYCPTPLIWCPVILSPLARSPHVLPALSRLLRSCPLSFRPGGLWEPLRVGFVLPRCEKPRKLRGFARSGCNLRCCLVPQPRGNLSTRPLEEKPGSLLAFVP